jgi:hypothetical protein
MKPAAAVLLAAVPIAAVSIYAAALFPIPPVDGSPLYWLPRGASLGVIVSGLAFVARRAKWGWLTAVFVGIPITMVVLMGDLFVSVAYSCAHHRCI